MSSPLQAESLDLQLAGSAFVVGYPLHDKSCMILFTISPLKLFVERDDLFEGDLNIPGFLGAARDDMEFKMVLAASRFGRWPNGVMPYVISSNIGLFIKLFALRWANRSRLC